MYLKQTISSKLSTFEHRAKQYFFSIFTKGTKYEKKILYATSILSEDENGVNVFLKNYFHHNFQPIQGGSYSNTNNKIVILSRYLDSDNVILHEYTHYILEKMFHCEGLPYNNVSQMEIYKEALSNTFDNLSNFLDIVYNKRGGDCMKIDDLFTYQPQYNHDYTASLENLKSNIWKAFWPDRNCSYEPLVREIYSLFQNNLLSDKVQGYVEREAIVYFLTEPYLKDSPYAKQLLEPIYKYWETVVEQVIDEHILSSGKSNGYSNIGILSFEEDILAIEPTLDII